MADRRAWPPLPYLAAATAVVLAVYELFSFGRAIGQGLLLTFMGVLLAFVVHFPIDLLSRFLPRGLAAVVTLVVSLATMAALWWLALPAIAEQTAQAIRQLPGVVEAVHAQLQRVAFGPLARALDPGLGEALRERAVALASGLLGEVTGLVTGVTGVILAGIFVIGIAFFGAYEPQLYVNGLLRLVPERRRPRMARLLSELGRRVQRWVLGALFSMTLVGLLTALGLHLLGLQGWLVLALLAFMLEFIPFVGPLISAIPGVLLALASSPALAVWTALMYVAIQQVEGNVLQPLIMRKAVHIPPALLLLWQVAASLAFGFVGLIVATPLLAVILVVVRVYYLEPEETPGT